MEKSNFCCDLNSPQKGKSKVLPIALVSLAILFVGGITGAYFYLGQPDFVSDVPPTLDLIGSKFQGQSIGDQLGSLVFDQTDVDTYSAPTNANFKPATKGVQYYFSEREITVEEIIKNIKPQSGLQILIAFYSPGEEELGTNKCYYIYPKGPYSGTCEIQNVMNFKLPKGRGYAIIGSKDFEYNSDVIKNAKTSPSAEYLENFKANEGWVLLPVKNNDTLKTSLSNNIWVLSADNQFVKTDATNPSLKNNYQMAWFKIAPQDAYQAR
jgi:flagellar basal body-associated protein FliL